MNRLTLKTGLAGILRRPRLTKHAPQAPGESPAEDVSDRDIRENVEQVPELHVSEKADPGMPPQPQAMESALADNRNGRYDHEYKARCNSRAAERIRFLQIASRWHEDILVYSITDGHAK